MSDRQAEAPGSHDSQLAFCSSSFLALKKHGEAFALSASKSEWVVWEVAVQNRTQPCFRFQLICHLNGNVQKKGIIANELSLTSHFKMPKGDESSLMRCFDTSSGPSRLYIVC